MAARYLSRCATVKVFDAQPEATASQPARASWEEAAGCPVIVLAVPISRVEEVCRSLAPGLSAGQVVVDTCSVKQRPLAVMQRELPEDVEIVGTHPLFGPDSGKEGIAGLKIAVCPVRVSRQAYRQIRDFLESIGLVVIETTAEEHDRQLARSQAIFHLIAEALKQLDWEGQAMSTPGPEAFFRLVRTVQTDTNELFQDLERENPFAAPYRRRFLAQLKKLNDELR